MKTKNKYLAIISALMICIVLFSGLFPVKVSAADYSDLDIYYLTGGTGDWEGIKKEVVEINDIDFNKKSNYPEYSAYIVSAPPGTKKESWTILTYDLSSEISRFKIGFGIIPYNTLNTINPYYIYFCGVSNDPPYGDIPILVIQIFASNSPIRYDLIDNEYCLSSDSDIVYAATSFPISGLTDTYREGRLNSFGHQVISSSISTDTRFDFSELNYPSDVEDVKNGKYFNFNGGNSSRSITWNEIYTNCDLEINGQNLKNELFKSLKDQIDVKLTPEFGMDMDRVFDKNTGQNDYFKFEITNNSDTAIQWCAYIVGSEYEDNENGIDNVEDTRYLVPGYEYCKWLYIKDEIYYSSTVKKEKKYLDLKTETRLCTNRKTGNFYFHLLKPGQTFIDYIYWENVNIQPLKSYDIRFNCLPIENLAYPSDMFSSRYFIDTVGSILGTDYEKEEGFDDYVIDDTLYTEIYRCSFSVLDIPDFTTTVRGGDSVGNGGFSDAETLKNNFETLTDLSDGKVHANSNYVENPLLLNGSDVNVDLNNVTIDNVKSYISQCSDFFSLIKSVLIVFPAWIWVLICFGLTALIVISIVRYIRG